MSNKKKEQKKCCKNCKHHTNKPSFCHHFDRHTRREDICDVYRKN